MPIYTIKLVDHQIIADNTIAFTFEKPAGFTYIAGQYGGFTLINPQEKDEKGHTRRFSYLSMPDDHHITIATRIQTSAFKRNLKNLNIADPIKMAGPSGNFVLHDDTTKPAVMIAGGIGIAPLYSMIRHALIKKPEQQITLFYGNRTIADSALLSEILDLQINHPQLKVIPVLVEPPSDWNGEIGFVTDEMVLRNIADINTPIFYVCGSPAMVAAMQQMLLVELAIPEERVKVEDFPGY